MSVYHTVWMLHKAKTARLVITLYRHITDILPHITNCRPTVGRLSADCRPTDSLTNGRQTANKRRQSADSRPTDGRQSANRWPTVGRQVFWGPLLHNYPPERDYSLSKGEMTLEKGLRSQCSKDVQLHDSLRSPMHSKRTSYNFC